MGYVTTGKAYNQVSSEAIEFLKYMKMKDQFMKRSQVVRLLLWSQVVRLPLWGKSGMKYERDSRKT